MVPLSHTILERGIHFNYCKYTVKYEKKITETGSFLSFSTATKCACPRFFILSQTAMADFSYLLKYLINLKPQKGTLLVGASPYGPL